MHIKEVIKRLTEQDLSKLIDGKILVNGYVYKGGLIKTEKGWEEVGIIVSVSVIEKQEVVVKQIVLDDAVTDRLIEVIMSIST